MVSPRVLIIEDNLANLELLSYLLRSHGCNPHSAVTGEAALDWLRDEEHPHLILCDIQLPGIDGYELAQRLKANTTLAGIPLVAVTALAMVGDRERVLSAGFDGYIGKPIEPDKFIGVVNSYLGPELQLFRDQPVSETVLSGVEAAGTKGVILVVDDIPTNISVLRSVLEPSGYVVLSASTVVEAMCLLEGTQPDLILSDLHLPGSAAFEFIESVKLTPNLQAIPFLYISATGKKESLRNIAIDAGAMRFLFRPIGPRELLAEIEACLPARN